MTQRLDEQVDDRRTGKDTDIVTKVYPLAVTRKSENKKMATARKRVKEKAYRPHRTGFWGRESKLLPPSSRCLRKCEWGNYFMT